jgi:hypothetical protein
MAEIKCLCGHWCSIHHNYCPTCGRKTHADTLTELVEMDEQAIHDYRMLPTVEECLLCALFLGTGTSFFSTTGPDAIARLREGMQVLLFTGFLFFLMLWGRMRLLRKDFTKRYKRLWALPATFRPSVPKP